MLQTQQVTGGVHSRSRYLAASVLAFFMALLVLWLLLYLNLSRGGTWSAPILLASLAVFALLMAIGIILSGSRRDDFDPLAIVYPLTALYALHFPIRALITLLWPDILVHYVNWPVDSLRYMSLALALSIFGMVSFYLGYFWKGSARLANIIPAIPFQFDGQYLVAKILALYTTGMLGFLILFSEGDALRFLWDADRSSWTMRYVWSLLGDLRYVAVLLAWSRPKRSPMAWILALGLLAVTLLTGIVVGSKNSAFIALLAVVFAYHYVLKQRLRRVILATATIFLLVIFPVVQTYRQVYKTEVGFVPDPTLGDIASAATALQRTAEVDSLFEWVEDALIMIANRAAQLDQLTMVVRYVPSLVEYQRGQTLATIVTGFVPRVLWSDKPVLNYGSFMNKIIIGSTSNNNVGFTNTGEFYLNFGVAGVPVGMFLLGMSFAVVYTYSRRCNKSRVIQAIVYYSVFPEMLLSGSGIVSIYVGWSRVALLVLAVSWLLSLGSRGAPEKPDEAM